MKKKAQPTSFAVLIGRMKHDGLVDEAERLDSLLCKTAWTTGSEFLGEFGHAMKKIKRASWKRMNDSTRTAFKSAARTILKAWPRLGL
jgi:hypothetical protein